MSAPYPTLTERRAERAPATRVVVACGPAIVNDALVARLSQEPALLAIAVSGNNEAAVRDGGQLAPDVVVVDCSEGTPRPMTLVARLRALPQSPRVVALLAVRDAALTAELIEAGATAIVAKSAPVNDLVAAIGSAAKGMTWVSAQLMGDLLAHLRTGPGHLRDERLRALTPRELEILTLIVEGLSRRDIATELYVSLETVRTHIGTILHKLGVHSAIAAAAIGRSAGLRRRQLQTAASIGA